MTGKDDLKKDTDQQAESAQQDAQQEKDVQDHSGDVPNEPVSPRTQGRSVRLLLLVLLLVILAAVAWFVYFAPQQSVHSPGVLGDSVAQRETRPIPSREQESSKTPQAQSQTDAAPGESSSPAGQDEPPKSKQDVTEESVVPRQAIPRPAAENRPQAAMPTMDAPKGGAAEGDGERTASANKKTSRPSASEETDSSAQKKVQKAAVSVRDSDPGPASESGQTEPVSEQAGSPEKRSEQAVARGAYTVQVGAYSVVAHLAADQKKLHDLGFETSILETQRPIRMTRLRVGTFFPSQGETQMARLKEHGAEPFFVKDGDLMMVYAGSFRSEKRAERLSRRLAEAGVHVEAERTSVDVQLSILRFGPFESFAEARSAARKAGDAGLETLIVKMR